MPFAAVDKNCEITILSEAFITHHAKSLGMRGIEYVPTFLKIDILTSFIEIYCQHLDAKIKYIRVAICAIKVEINNPCNPIFNIARTITFKTVVAVAEIKEAIVYLTLSPNPLTNCKKSAVNTCNIT